MGGHEFTWKYYAHYFDVDAHRRVTPFALLRYFEDIAIQQSEDVGVGIDYYNEEQVAWLLSRWDVRISALPRHREEISVLTQPMQMRGFLANRRFSIHGADGTIMVEADSQWIFLDAARKRPRRITEELYSRYGVHGESDGVPSPRSPRPVEQVDKQREFSVRMSDIDTNGHVNNIRYVEWAFETLPPEMVRASELRRLLVQYKKEVRYGVDVTAHMSLSEEDGSTVARHGISSGEQLACALESHWQSAR